MWILSYVAGNFGLILVTFLAVLGLSAVAWFAKNWKVALAAVAVLGAGLAYLQIDKQAYQRRVAEEAAGQIAVLRSRLASEALINANYAARAKADADRLSDLERQANETPANTGICLDRAGAGRVRGIH
jgi:apolipoprotein N-acyltransferase